jgi:2-methylcitrate dehydratase PrpD
VMGLDEARMAIAIGIAANQSAGLREVHGTDSSAFTQGHTARCGLTAAVLAARGYGCSDTVLEGPKGFAASFGESANLEAALDGLGETYEISTLAYKPYPCGFVIHPIIDACLEIVKAEKFDHTRIERIELTVNPLAVKLCDRPNPETRRQAIVSLQHWTAASLVYKAAGIEQFSEAALHESAVVNIRRKIVATSEDSIGREAAIARVIMQDGKNLEAKVLDCRGSARRPMSDDDLSQKTLVQLKLAFESAASEALLAECWRIAEYPRVEALCKRLAPA